MQREDWSGMVWIRCFAGSAFGVLRFGFCVRHFVFCVLCFALSVRRFVLGICDQGSWVVFDGKARDLYLAPSA